MVKEEGAVSHEHLDEHDSAVDTSGMVFEDDAEIDEAEAERE